MPVAAIGLGLGTALSGAAAAGATVYGARKAGQASQRAAAVQAQSDAEAMAFERERDAEARRQWEADQAFQQQQFAAQEEERLYARRLAEEREARLAPYRQASAAALGRLGNILGIQVPQGAQTSGGTAPMSKPLGIPTGSWGRPWDRGGDEPMLAAAMDPLRGAYGYTRGRSLTLADIGTPGELMPVNTASTLGAQLQIRSRRPLTPGSY